MGYKSDDPARQAKSETYQRGYADGRAGRDPDPSYLGVMYQTGYRNGTQERHANGDSESDESSGDEVSGYVEIWT